MIGLFTVAWHGYLAQQIALCTLVTREQPSFQARFERQLCNVNRGQCAGSILSMLCAGDIQKLRSSQNLRKMSSPAVVGSAVCADDAESSCSDDRSSPLSSASAASHFSGRRQPASRASFSTLDRLPSEPLTPLKKSSLTPKSCLPRPSSTSKLPLQRKSVTRW